jgi:hypothetical protein
MSFLRTADWEAARTWLAACGGLLVLLSVVYRTPKPTAGGVLGGGVLTSNTERLKFAAQTTGTVLAALAGVMTLAANVPSLLFIAVVAASVLLTIWWLLAWKVRQFWQGWVEATSGDLRQAEENPQAGPPWRYLCATRCATWRWCLRHPFNDGASLWPEECRTAVPGFPSRDPSAPEERQLRIWLDRVRALGAARSPRPRTTARP